MVCEGGNICWGSVLESPRKPAPPDGSLETVFGTDTSGVNIMTKGGSRLRACGWVGDLRGVTVETQLRGLSRGRVLTLSDFQSCSRAFIRLRMPGALSHGVKPGEGLLGPGVGIRRGWKRSPILILQKKTYSSVAQRRSFSVCKQGSC